MPKKFNPFLVGNFDETGPAGGGDIATDTIWDAKGDLAVGTGANTASRLPVGTNGQVIVADSAEPTGLKWSTVSGTGDVVGPASAVNNNFAAFDTTTGKLIKDSGSKASDFATASHTHTASQVTDFDTEVSNNTDVAANTAARHTHANQAVLDATTASFTTADETKLDGIEALADVTDAGNVGSSIDGATAKTTPVDADTMPLIDSAASNVLKKGTWANIKATLKTYFDTLYPSGSGTSTGSNTGDQTSIVGITGTKAQFDTAITDGNILYVGDITQYTDEMAQDAVGAMVDASLAYVDGTPLLQRAALTGDVTASAGSNTTTIANDAVTYAKMQNVSATDKLLGRSTAGAGDVEEITCTAAGRALLDDANAAAQVTTLGLDNTKLGVAGITIDGAGSAITTGIKGYIRIPYAGTITKATVLADQSGSIVIDVWKDTYANYPPTVADTIVASAKPTLSSAIKSEDSTLTGWTTSVTAGDVLGFKVDSASTLTRVTLELHITKS